MADKTNTRFDVVYSQHGVTIEPHFCRVWDGNDKGCYGTNSDHGFSLDEACEQIAEWYEAQAKLWRDRNTYECYYYMENNDEYP